MNWDKVKSLVGQSAPLLATLIGGPVGAVSAIVASALGTDNTPDAIEQAIKTDPEAALKLRTVESNNQTALELAAITAEQSAFQTTHATIQKELDSNDKFKSYWRPAFGYALVTSWVLTWLGVLYVVIFETDKSAVVINAIAGTTMLWGIALSVLGVQISKRSHDKQVAAGQEPTTLLGSLRTALKG